MFFPSFFITDPKIAHAVNRLYIFSAVAVNFAAQAAETDCQGMFIDKISAAVPPVSVL